MWRVLLAATGAVIGQMAGGSEQSWSGVGVRCGSVTPIDVSAPFGHAIPVGRALWLGVYPFALGYPTKTIVMAQRRLKGRIVLRGWDCTNGGALRFWYREEEPFSQVPVTPARLRRTGSLGATVGPWPARAQRGGYLMFWHTGNWKIVAYADGRALGTAVVRADPN